MISAREVIGFLVLLVLVFGVAQTPFAEHGLSVARHTFSMWWFKVAG